MSAMEVEAKFQCTSPIDPRRLEETLLAMDFILSWVEPQEQIDIYFDDLKGTLLSRGDSLRFRNTDRCWIGTYKTNSMQNAAVFSRSEIEWSPTADVVEKFQNRGIVVLPEEILLPTELSQADLKKVLEIRTIRRKAIASDLGGQLELEIALDAVTFYGRNKRAYGHELEIEIKKGDAARLSTISQAISRILDLTPSVKSKFHSGMELVGESTP